ncbi:dimethylargininase [Nitzschia inconspicua]|uniref:Dimethylargininase n=1 Tax=Nitzschia inconspicua TaxID=303405 RepID=A0A9K3PXL9_9STRA|nr:dimethylargininase [Nitzschia inconspicua]
MQLTTTSVRRQLSCLEKMMYLLGRGSRTRSLSTTSPAAAPQYTLAIARQVPRSFPNAITKFAAATSSDTNISLTTTIQQHDAYLKTLRSFVPTVCLPALDDLPDSMFVEDTVVVMGNNAVITHPGHPARRAEVDSIRDFLGNQLGMSVKSMSDYPNAFCDGGDILNTSRHLFVGLSERTNRESIQVLEEVLQVEVIPVTFEGNALHLKSIVTHVDDSTLLAPIGSLGDDVIKTMQAIEKGYTVIRIPNMLACNVVSVNGGLVAQNMGDEEIRSILMQVAEDRNMRVAFVDCSEIAKADAALTCCSVLLKI